MIVATSLPSAPSSRALAHFTFVELGSDAEGSPLLPIAINDRGEICAYASGAHPSGIVRAYKVCRGGPIPVGAAFGQRPVAALSNEGQVAGAAGNGPNALRAWASHLGTFGAVLWPTSVSVARGINSAGHVIGEVRFDAGHQTLSRAFLITDGHWSEYLRPPGGGLTQAVAINDRGDVLFNASALMTVRSESDAWCLTRGEYVPVAGAAPGRSTATALAPDGTAVGHTVHADGSTTGFVWRAGRAQGLGSDLTIATYPSGVNDRGTVVGRLLHANGSTEAFIWTAAQGLQPLAAFVSLPRGWHLAEANGVNANGEIIGIGTVQGRRRGFLLKPETTL